MAEHIDKEWEVVDISRLPNRYLGVSIKVKVPDDANDLIEVIRITGAKAEAAPEMFDALVSMMNVETMEEGVWARDLAWAAIAKANGETA